MEAFILETTLREKIRDLLIRCSALGEVLWLFDTGGKRLRPRFIMAILQDLMSQTEASGQLGLEVAVSVELLHIASLVHDDLPCLDDAQERRGHPAAHIKFGEAQALLIGDLLPMLAVRSILDAEAVSPGKKNTLIDIATASYQRLCEGQMQELSAKGNLDEFIKIAANKTGALFALCLEAGAVLANSDIKLRQILRDLGLNIGIYFQGLDDIADGDAVIHADAMNDLRIRIEEGLEAAEKTTNRSLSNLRALIKEAIKI